MMPIAECRGGIPLYYINFIQTRTIKNPFAPSSLSASAQDHLGLSLPAKLCSSLFSEGLDSGTQLRTFWMLRPNLAEMALE